MEGGRLSDAEREPRGRFLVYIVYYALAEWEMELADVHDGGASSYIVSGRGQRRRSVVLQKDCLSIRKSYQHATIV